MAFRLARLTDAQGLSDLYVSVQDELVADYGDTVPLTRAQMREWLQLPQYRVIVYDNGPAILGGAVFWRDGSQTWWCILTAVVKTLTAQQRLDGFRDMLHAIAGQVPGDTKFGGVVREGRRLDLYMQPRFADRTVAEGMVTYRATAADLAALT